jgi:hypothetical protein
MEKGEKGKNGKLVRNWLAARIMVNFSCKINFPIGHNCSLGDAHEKPKIYSSGGQKVLISPVAPVAQRVI